MESQKSVNDDAIFSPEAPTSVPQNEDIYSLKSDNTDILKLQICKSQPSKEAIMDCLTIQQSQIKYESEHSSMLSLEFIGCFSLVCIAALIAIWRFMKYFGEN